MSIFLDLGENLQLMSIEVCLSFTWNICACVRIVNRFMRKTVIVQCGTAASHIRLVQIR